jgi:hypothetical protein
MTETRFPHGALKLATEVLRNDAAARAVLAAVIPVIERAVLRQAAGRILLLDALARGWRCPACHGKPATTPSLREGRTGYTCGCGHAWEPPKHPDYGMEPERLLRRLARGEPLPDLPAKDGDPR